MHKANFGFVYNISSKKRTTETQVCFYTIIFYKIQNVEKGITEKEEENLKLHGDGFCDIGIYKYRQAQNDLHYWSNNYELQEYGI